ncbi:SH3 domain-containing protein [Streptomyces sp. NPDC048231]|uniref:SH3 domain-containing protein n=1 Tax=Streptomyces sp. NPDC048231 TaxID=3365519 RepID=UPI0037218F47
MTSGRRRFLLLAGATGAFLMALGSPASATADALRYYPVAPGVQLNVRSGPGMGYSVVRQLPAGAKVAIFCQSPGTTVSGYYGTSNIWDNIDSGEYVSDAYVNTGSDGYVAERCG